MNFVWSLEKKFEEKLLYKKIKEKKKKGKEPKRPYAMRCDAIKIPSNMQKQRKGKEKINAKIIRK